MLMDQLHFLNKKRQDRVASITTEKRTVETIRGMENVIHQGKKRVLEWPLFAKMNPEKSFVLCLKPSLYTA